MTDELTFLRLLRDKVDLLIPQISINEPLIEISAMLGSRIRVLTAVDQVMAYTVPGRVRIVHSHAVSDPEGAADWLEAHFPTLYNFLLMSDYFTAGVIWDGPPHTISWHIATAAAAGSVVAKMACECLNLLSSNHCTNALINE